MALPASLEKSRRSRTISLGLLVQRVFDENVRMAAFCEPIHGPITRSMRRRDQNAKPTATDELQG